MAAVKLRKITANDAETLVDWRNADSEWFPRSEILTMRSHLDWYRGAYLTDPSQNLYIIEVADNPIGTIGLNIRNGSGEISRVILGDKEYARTGYMSKALNLLVDTYGLDYYWLRVLPNNGPAIAFYKRNKFLIKNWCGGEYTDVNGRSGQYITMSRLTII